LQHRQRGAPDDLADGIEAEVQEPEQKGEPVRNRRERLEAEKRRLREEAEILLERGGTDRHPTDEEIREFGERVAKFGSKVRPPGSTLYGILAD